MSDRINVICGDCFFYINEEMQGNSLGGGVRAGQCHGGIPKVGEGWPLIEPTEVGCRHWKKGGVLKSVIGTPDNIPADKTENVIIEDGMADPGMNPLVGMPPMEEPCQSTNTSVSAGRGSTISQKPGDESVPLSPADVGKKLSESPAVLDSPSVEPSTKINPTEIRR